MTLSPQARKEVQWWITHIYQFLHAPPITTIIYSDSSLEGWGATDSISTIGAPWQDTDELMHINVLELTAGDSNVVADFHSSCFYENKEWAIKDMVFAFLKHTYGSPGIDLFASSTNAKMPLYIRWLPDPNAYAGFKILCFSSI